MDPSDLRFQTGSRSAKIDSYSISDSGMFNITDSSSKPLYSTVPSRSDNTGKYEKRTYIIQCSNFYK